MYIITIMNRIAVHTENAEYQIIQALKLNRVKRNKLQEVFVEGIECIKQAIKSNMEITRIIISNGRHISDWAKNIIKQYGNAAVIDMSDDLYRSLCDRTDPSELLITAKIRKYDLSNVDAENPFIIACDRPGDFGNLGSIIRSANAFNADALFIVGHGIDVYEPKVIRASLGSIFFTKTVYIESMEIFEEFIKIQKTKNNLQIIGTDSTGTVSLKDETIKRPVMLILGNEAKGMSLRLKELCDTIIRIPMTGNVNSLNVSCAASILMWEVYKNDI